jgi:hypothetical protein
MGHGAKAMGGIPVLSHTMAHDPSPMTERS